jgi:tRNA(His) guanylyltransferase
MSKDEFGDRMKAYEARETERRLDSLLPVYARIDGRSFSRFTRGLARPFDPRMTQAMINTTCHLVEKTNASIGYTQSDEISLIWESKNELSQMFFNGKIQKLVSVLASMATVAFNYNVFNSGCPEFKQYTDRLPHFDARVFGLPSRDEGANAFLWREKDATRNAVQMVAHTHFSPRQLHGVGVNKMKDMLWDICIHMTDFPDTFTRGSFVRRVYTYHDPEPGVSFMRSQVERIDMPPFLSVKNRVEVIFDGADPVT